MFEMHDNGATDNVPANAFNLSNVLDIQSSIDSALSASNKTTSLLPTLLLVARDSPGPDHGPDPDGGSGPIHGPDPNGEQHCPPQGTPGPKPPFC